MSALWHWLRYVHVVVIQEPLQEDIELYVLRGRLLRGLFTGRMYL